MDRDPTPEEQAPLVGALPKYPLTCPECGQGLKDRPRFCPGCGRRFGPEPARPGPRGQMEGYAVASIACGVAGLFAAPIFGPVLAIVFGKKAKERIAEDPSLEGANLASAGTTLGWVGLAVSAVV